jgi:hypothetical protein
MPETETSYQPTMLEELLEEIMPYEDTNDPLHRTHIVRPPENKHIFRIGMSAQDIVDTARAAGKEVVALCGYRFVPKHNPEKYDACEACMRVAGMLMNSEGE